MNHEEEIEILTEALRDSHELLAEVRESLLMSIDSIEVYPTRYALLISINKLLDMDKELL